MTIKKVFFGARNIMRGRLGSKHPSLFKTTDTKAFSRKTRPRNQLPATVSAILLVAVSGPLPSFAHDPSTPPTAKPNPSAPLKFHSRIIGGVTSAQNSRPWQVSLFWKGQTPAQGHFCGGALIDRDWVLTAAHCLNENTLRKGFQVLAGTQDLRAPGIIFDVDKFIPHENYDDIGYINDIALLHLKRTSGGDARSGRAVFSPISLGDGSQDPDFGIVAGFGQTAEGDARMSPLLQEVRVPIVSNDTCNQPASYNGAITEGKMCAGDVDKDSCQGDSGGPLIERLDDGSFRLIGVTSYGEGCGQPLKFGVYTRVSKYIEWINAHKHISS